MKKAALVSVAITLLGTVVLSGPALAQNQANFTNINTANSTFFGFAPADWAATVQAFTQSTNTYSCSGTTVVLCSSGNYVKNGQMPGSLTQRPDKVVSANPDFGCGAQVASYTDCLEATINLQDRVNGNTTTANLAAGTGGNGQNTAPTSQTPTGGGGPSGVLIGDMTSEVYMESLDDGMPSGSIVFNRTDGSDGTIDVDFDQTVSSEILGLQTFTEHDYTLTSFVAIPCTTAPQCTTFPSTAFPGTVAGQVGSRHSGVAGGFPQSNLGIRAELDLTQTSLGGLGTATEEIGYAVDWQGNGTAPTPGAYFTPGLNVADWTGSAGLDTNGF